MVGPLRACFIVPFWIVHRQYTVLIRDLQDIRPTPTSCFTKCTLLTDKEVASIVALNPALSEGEVRRRTDSGQACYLFWVGERLAHYRWLSDKPVYLPFMGKTFLLGERDYLVSEVFTHPDFRERGIFSATSQWCLARARRQGFERSIAIVASWNRPSLLVAQFKAQRRPAGNIHIWTLGPWTHCSVTGDLRLGPNDTVFIRQHTAPRTPGAGIAGSWRSRTGR